MSDSEAKILLSCCSLLALIAGERVRAGLSPSLTVLEQALLCQVEGTDLEGVWLELDRGSPL